MQWYLLPAWDCLSSGAWRRRQSADSARSPWQLGLMGQECSPDSWNWTESSQHGGEARRGEQAREALWRDGQMHARCGKTGCGDPGLLMFPFSHLHPWFVPFVQLSGSFLIDVCTPLLQPLCNTPGRAVRAEAQHFHWNTPHPTSPFMQVYKCNASHSSVIQNLSASWFLPLPLLCQGVPFITYVVGDCSLIFLKWLSWNQIA